MSRELTVVIPFGGPKDPVTSVWDTIASIWYYCGKDTRVIVVEDGKHDWPGNPPFDLVKGLPGRYSALYFNQCLGYKLALDDPQCKVVLKMDADALVVGEHPELDALALFTSQPELGSVGTFRDTPWGEKRLFFPHANDMHRDMDNQIIHNAWISSRDHSYSMGEHCQGGCHFISIAALKSMKQCGYLDLAPFDTHLEDDVLFGLFCSAAGFNQDVLPCIGSQWRKFPLREPDYLPERWKVVHSLKAFDRAKEEEVRAILRQQRFTPKVHLGCGQNLLSGWSNYGREVDISQPLYFQNDSTDYIFTEHVIEHITPAQLWNFLKECRRVLKPGGVLRLAFPDIDRMNDLMTNEYLDYLKKKTGRPATREQAIECIVSDWGHQGVWTSRGLSILLTTLGFTVSEQLFGKSEHLDLCGLEGRSPNRSSESNRIETSILEAIKP